MKLDWRDVGIEGWVVRSSITQKEVERLVEVARGRRVLEIGTAYGYAAASMARVAAHVTTIDPHAGYGSMPESLEKARALMDRLELAQVVTIIVGRSCDVTPWLISTGQQFDMAFIDGDHRFHQVLYDLVDAYEMLELGGVLAVHDYGEDTCPDVRQAVDVFTGDRGLYERELVDTLLLITKKERGDE